MDIPFVFGKIADGEDFTDRTVDTEKLKNNFSSRKVLTKYQLGTSANIKNLKKAMQDKNLIDVMPDAITLQDPVFAYWLKEKY